MIRIQRGREPQGLAAIRRTELARVGAIAAVRPPTSDEIGIRYQEVQRAIYERQFYKCCYCEFKEQQNYNDVEHYRPKAAADRRPGSLARHGYWWLAWTWQNLLFACPTCNRSYKRTQFPLDHGSTALPPPNAPPGSEKPLLLDPADRIDPIDHIEFCLTSMASRHYWMPRPRSGSRKGEWTIRVVGLDRPDLLDHYNEHVRVTVMPVVNRIEATLASQNAPAIGTFWAEATKRLLNARLPLSGLSYDALDHYFPLVRRQPFALTLPRPSPL